MNTARNGAITCYPPTRDPADARAVAICAAHQAIKARIGKSCGIWHHHDLTPAEVATHPAELLPANHYEPAGWVSCWQHPATEACPGPDLTGGRVHADVLLPGFERILWSYQGCTCHTLPAAIDQAWESFGDACIDGARQLTQGCLIAYRHHVVNHDHPVLLPPAFPSRPGVHVVLSMYAAHANRLNPADGYRDAGQVWDEYMNPALPGWDDPAHAFDWRESVATAAKNAATYAALLHRGPWRAAQELPEHQDCPEGTPR